MCECATPGENVAGSEKPSPVFGKTFPTLLSPPWFIVIGNSRRITLRASKLSADSFCNPPNAGIEGLAAVRSVVVGRTRPLRFFFRRHADAPSSESIG